MTLLDEINERIESARSDGIDVQVVWRGGGIYGDMHGDGRPIEVPKGCSCHPDDNPPQPCPGKHALTHCRAADLGKRLRHAITTAMNDDYSDVGTEKRKRHLDRIEVMSAAAAFLEDRW